MGQTFSEVIDQLVEDRELGFRFFAVFSRFEYALKRHNFLKKGRSGEAIPDWYQFETQLRGHFIGVKDERFTIACEYLKQEPPKKQIVKQGRLSRAPGRLSRSIRRRCAASPKTKSYSIQPELRMRDKEPQHM